MVACRNFTHSIEWYAQLYGIGPGTAKRLSAAGVNFDGPEEMRKYAKAVPCDSEGGKSSTDGSLTSTKADWHELWASGDYRKAEVDAMLTTRKRLQPRTVLRPKPVKRCG